MEGILENLCVLRVLEIANVKREDLGAFMRLSLIW